MRYQPINDVEPVFGRPEINPDEIAKKRMFNLEQMKPRGFPSGGPTGARTPPISIVPTPAPEPVMLPPMPGQTAAGGGGLMAGTETAAAGESGNPLKDYAGGLMKDVKGMWEGVKSIGA